MRAFVLVLAVLSVVPTLHGTLRAAGDPPAVQDFSSDPFLSQGSGAAMEVRGDAAAYLYEPDSPSRFPGDPRGSLRVEIDSLAATSRAFERLARPLEPGDDFVLGAILTVRPGMEADPFGFHPIAVSLFNTTTTGDDRTGDLDDFRADSFDTLEMAYFPNVSPFFGGPYLSATAFGAPAGDDAFLDFAFTSVPAALQPGTTYLVQLQHTAAARTFVLQLWRTGADGRFIELSPARVVCDLSSLEGFLLDAVGIPTYHDGFNVFATSGRSLRATVDYDLLFAARLEDGKLPPQLASVLGRLRFAKKRLIAPSPLP